MKDLNRATYESTYKFDKISDYLNFLATAQLAVLGFLLSSIEKIKLSEDLEWLFPLSVFLVAVSLAIALYGKTVLLSALFKEKGATDKAIKRVVLSSGLMFASIIIALMMRWTS